MRTQIALLSLLAFAAAGTCSAQFGAVIGKNSPTTGVIVEISTSPVTAFAFDGHHMWAAYAGGISKIRVSDNATVRQIALRSTPAGMCWDGASLWFVDGTTLFRDTPQGMYTYDVPGGNPTSVGVHGEYLYVGAGKPGAGVIHLYRMTDLQRPVGFGGPQSVSPAISFPILGPNTRPVQFASTSEHMLAGTQAGIFTIVTSKLAPEPLRWVSAQSLAVSANTLFCTQPESKELLGMSLGQTFPGVLRYYALSDVPSGLVSDGADVWVSYRSGVVENVAGTRRFTIGGTPGIMAFDGTFLWVAHQELYRNGKSYVNKM